MDARFHEILTILSCFRFIYLWFIQQYLYLNNCRYLTTITIYFNWHPLLLCRCVWYLRPRATEWPYAPSNENDDCETMKVLLNFFANCESSDWPKGPFIYIHDIRSRRSRKVTLRHPVCTWCSLERFLSLFTLSFFIVYYLWDLYIFYIHFEFQLITSQILHKNWIQIRSSSFRSVSLVHLQSIWDHLPNALRLPNTTFLWPLTSGGWENVRKIETWMNMQEIHGNVFVYMKVT